MKIVLFKKDSIYSIGEIKRRNREAGHSFFAINQKATFNIRACLKVANISTITLGSACLFITSDRTAKATPRRYTIRMIVGDGSIQDVNGLQYYATRNEALRDMYDFARWLREGIV